MHLLAACWSGIGQYTVPVNLDNDPEILIIVSTLHRSIELVDNRDLTMESGGGSANTSN